MPHCSWQIYRDRRVIKLSFSLTVHSHQALRTPTKSLTHTHTHTLQCPSSPLDLESVAESEILDLAVVVSKTHTTRFASSLVIWGLFRVNTQHKLCLFEGGVHTDSILKRSFSTRVSDFHRAWVPATGGESRVINNDAMRQVVQTVACRLIQVEYKCRLATEIFVVSVIAP